MHRLTRLLILASATIVWLGCSAEPEPEPIAETAAPLYVDVTGGGHGPFGCVGDVPFRGYADLSSPGGACQRVRGDFINNGYPGRVLSGALIPAGATTLTLSTHELGHTGGFACKSPATGPASDPCRGQPTSDVVYFNNQSFVVNSLPWTPAAIVLGYTVTCPTGGRWTHFQFGAGAQTPEDGSGLPTARITDDFGGVLNAPNGTSIAVDCGVDVHTLQPNWYGVYVAVYTY
jgi:hypothetical protein